MAEIGKWTSWCFEWEEKQSAGTCYGSAELQCGCDMGAKAALEYYSLCACSTYCLLFLCWYSSDITVQTAVIGSLVQRLQFPARCCWRDKSISKGSESVAARPPRPGFPGGPPVWMVCFHCSSSLKQKWHTSCRHSSTAHSMYTYKIFVQVYSTPVLIRDHLRDAHSHSDQLILEKKWSFSQFLLLNFLKKLFIDGYW